MTYSGQRNVSDMHVPSQWEFEYQCIFAQQPPPSALAAGSVASGCSLRLGPCVRKKLCGAQPSAGL